MLDIPFARKVLDFAKLPPPGFIHDQNVVLRENECGTSCCIAGICTLLSPDCVALGDYHPVTGERLSQSMWVVNDQVMNWQQTATALLGLSIPKASALFVSDNENALELLESYIAEAEAEL
jgi:hypothetical protein